jgi:acetyl-CoA acetyltransferase
MKKNTNKKGGMSGGKMVAVGAGIAAAGAGAYYLFGPKAKAHQKKAKVLMGKMEKEVASEIKKVKEVTHPIYHKAVDVISKNYAKQYKLHEKDIKAFAEKMKSEWKNAAKKSVKKPVKTSKKKGA